MGSGNSKPFGKKKKTAIFSPVKSENSNSASNNQPIKSAKETEQIQASRLPPKTETVEVKKDFQEEFNDPFQSNTNENSQPSLSYAEAASLRPADTENMWAIVQKTCTNDGNWALNTVKNRRGWKTIRLFVSSTFRDFHAEREVLVKEVRHRLIRLQSHF